MIQKLLLIVIFGYIQIFANNVDAREKTLRGVVRVLQAETCNLDAKDLRQSIRFI